MAFAERQLELAAESGWRVLVLATVNQDWPSALPASANERSYECRLWVYLACPTLVICHEIDPAYWGEWELFRISGGAAVFVSLHLLIVPLILVGLVQLARRSPAARWTALFIGIAGSLGAFAHTAFLLSGDWRFSTGFSATLLPAFGL